jgi:4-hydroxybenzoate polyprenyltransferase
MLYDSNLMLAGLKIVAGVIDYRLRKLEMANLAAAASIAVALHLPWVDVFYRTAFAFVLNILVYLNNDYIDVGGDLHSTDKDNAKTRYLSEHLGAALWAQYALLALLVAAALIYDRGLLIPLLVGGGICWWYTAYLKRRPFLDVPAMMLWGLAMPLCGFPWQNAVGWCLALQLALFSGVFETIQVMRDAKDDAAASIRTTGVVLGESRTLLLARALMVGCTVYAALVVHPVAAVLSAAALAVPFASNHIARYWTHVKLVYGVTWLFVCAWIFFRPESAGILLSIR